MKDLMEEYYKVIVCDCGYYVKFLYRNNKDKLICPNCGHYVYKNEKIEFKEKMKRKLKEVKENGKGINNNNN